MLLMCQSFYFVFLFFFFQAEDGIRDKLVTGVQTCALPICSPRPTPPLPGPLPPPCAPGTPPARPATTSDICTLPLPPLVQKLPTGTVVWPTPIAPTPAPPPLPLGPPSRPGPTPDPEPPPVPEAPPPLPASSE